MSDWPSQPLPGPSRDLAPGHFRGAPCPTAGPARLASLRTRDMTLGGGSKKPRRTFEPNVHVVRKNKDDRLKAQTSTTPKQQRPEREEKRRERRTVKRERPQTIQSHSIFEQGPADCTWKTGRGTGLPESSHSLCAPLKREPEEDVHTVVWKLNRDDFIDDPALMNSSRLKPIQLPLCQSPTLRPAQSRATRKKIEVCEEKQPNLVELLCDLRLSDTEELFFMQLPDCMPSKAAGQKPSATASPGAPRPANASPGPSRPSTASPRAPRQATRDSKPHNKVSAQLQTQDPVLACSPEGPLGKLQLRRSGRVVLKLGDISMDVTEGAAFSFLQQLVSVRLSEGRSGDMMVLGNVSHKLVLSPDFQTLLDQSGSKNH